MLNMIRNQGKQKEKHSGNINNVYNQPIEEIPIEDLVKIDEGAKIGIGLEDTTEKGLKLWRMIDNKIGKCMQIIKVKENMHTFSKEYIDSLGGEKSINIQYEEAISLLEKIPNLFMLYVDKKVFIEDNYENFEKIETKKQEEIKRDVDNKSANEVLNLSSEFNAKYITKRELYSNIQKKFFIFGVGGAAGMTALKFAIKALIIALGI